MTLADDYISAKATISVSYAYIHATDTEKLIEAEHYFDFDNVNVLSIISLLIISNR